MIKGLVGIALACGCASSAIALAASAKTTPRHSAASPAVVAVLGSKVTVPPGRFVKAYAICPRGYYVTGGGVYNGAITVIASSPTTNLRGWFVDGTNNATQPFQERTDAVCAKGGPSVTLGTAARASSLTHQAEAQYEMARGTAGSR